MLEECGLIDDDYFLFYDCPNLGWKARLKNWNVRLVEGAKIWARRSELRRRPDIRKFVERSRVLTILRFMPSDKHPFAIGEYLHQTRKDETTYNEKVQAIKAAHQLFLKLKQYPSEPNVREKVYQDYCLPRIR